MKEALRGTLLSVLFFGLMVGGAPTMAAAEHPQSASSASQIKPRQGPCQTPGYVNTSSGCMSPDQMAHHNNCDMYSDLATVGGIVMGAGGLLVIIPEPITTFVGGVLGLIGFGGLATGGLAYVGNDC